MKRKISMAVKEMNVFSDSVLFPDFSPHLLSDQIYVLFGANMCECVYMCISDFIFIFLNEKMQHRTHWRGVFDDSTHDAFRSIGWVSIYGGFVTIFILLQAISDGEFIKNCSYLTLAAQVKRKRVHFKMSNVHFLLQFKHRHRHNI